MILRVNKILVIFSITDKKSVLAENCNRCTCRIKVFNIYTERKFDARDLFLTH